MRYREKNDPIDTRQMAEKEILMYDYLQLANPGFRGVASAAAIVGA
ncbi:MAG: hypothetical protein WB586_22615 [Chthoniobacterales bacterium]